MRHLVYRSTLMLSLCIFLTLGLPASAQENAIPRFDPAPCPVEFNTPHSVACGYVTVAETHNNPDGATIQVAVAVFHALSANPAPEPVIALVGGPGQNAVDLPRSGLGEFWGTIAKQHDLIILDQRGMGYSRPSLACPEVDAIKRRTAFEAGSTNDPLEIDAARECFERLMDEGVNVGAFNTVESAADIPDVIAALGYDDYNIYGGSYGSTLGLTVMRNHPEHLRSVILTSITPPQVDLMAGFSVNVEHNLKLLAELCKADANCATAYPDIETTFYDVIAQYNAQPLSVAVIHPLTDKRTTFALNGDDLVGAIMYMMYNPDSMGQIPAMLTALEAGMTDGLNHLVRAYLSEVDANSDGALYAMRCMDDVMTTTRADWEAALASVHPGLRGYWTSAMEWWYAICDMGWGAQQLDPIENTPVESDIPILLQSGKYDPVTPPVWGDVALETLPNGFHFVYPASAHNAYPTACAVRMFEAFLQDPTTEPDSRCIEQLPDLKFVTP